MTDLAHTLDLGPGPYALTYDVELRRPGCVMMAVVFGGNPRLAHLFEPNSWLLGPTDGMRTYRVTAEQLAQAIRGTIVPA